jgi:hypothetical protein
VTTSRFSLLIGLALGAVWALDDFGGMLIALVLAAVGGAVGWLVSRGAIDLSAIVGRRDDD